MESLKNSMKALLRLLPLWMILVTNLLANSDASSEPPKISMTYEIHSLRTERDDPQVFRSVAVFVFTWNPSQVPDFTIEKLHFLNRASELDQRVIPLTPRLSDGMTGVLISVRGLFDASNDFSAYPFHRVRLPLIFELPKYKGAPVKIVDAQVPYRHSPQAVVESDSYVISKVEVQQGPYFEIWSKSENLEKFSDINALAVVVDAEYRPTRSLIMVFVPLLLICVVVYSTLWWKEEGTASRAVIASLFSSTALAFSSINLQPNVAYPTGATLAFTFLYLEIAALGLFSLLAFRANKRGDTQTFRRLRATGRWLGIILFVIGSIVLGAWLFNHRAKPLHDWFHDSRHQMMVNQSKPGP
jgi:hypothetical protein